MIRNLKALGLALAAVFALTAFAASAASAQTIGKLTTGGGAVTIDAKQIGGAGANAITYPGASSVECEDSGVSFTAGEVGKTPHGTVPNNATTLTVTPHYTKCEASLGEGGVLATFTMNGCDYVFHTGETTVTEDEYGATMDLICPMGKVIEIHIYASTSSANILICTLTIPAQNGITGLDLTNELNGSKQTTGTLELTGIAKLTASKHGLCGAGESAEATYKAKVTLTGTNASKVATPITITH